MNSKQGYLQLSRRDPKGFEGSRVRVKKYQRIEKIELSMPQKIKQKSKECYNG